MKLYRCLNVLILPLALLTACDSSEKSVERKLVELGTADGCDASVQACLLAYEGVELQLELTKDIRTLQPFQLQIHVAGIQQGIESVNVEFFMEESSRVVARPEGFYWVADDGHQEFGPFPSAMDALVALREGIETRLEPSETLAEAEAEIGFVEPKLNDEGVPEE